MKSQVICIANRKGGVGKTTTAHALSCGLSDRGRRVLTVDLDGQKNLTGIMDASADGLTVYDVLIGKAEAKDVVQHTAQGDVIPAAAALEMADVEMKADDVLRLKTALMPLLPDYDFIVIDTPPSAGILTLNALMASDALIIPAKADITSIEGLDQMADMLNDSKDDIPNLRVLGILMNCFNGRSKVRRLMLDLITEAAAKMNTRIFETRIRDGVAVIEAQALRKSLFSAKSNVASDYAAWIDELERML